MVGGLTDVRVGTRVNMATDRVQSGIVVGVDGSPSAMAAVEWAARDAQLRNVALRLVNVVAPESVTNHSPWSGLTERPDPDRFSVDKTGSRQILELARRAAIGAVSPAPGADMISEELLFGSVVPTLAEYTEHADMLVVGCRSRTAFSRALLGSVSSGLAHHVHCPLGVIHEDEARTMRSPKAPVVVGIEGSSTSDSAIAIAFDEASRRGVDLIAFHAWNDEGPVHFGRPAHAPIEWANLQAREEEVLAERLAGWASRYPEVSVQRIVMADRPVSRLLGLAETAQLLVLGRHTHRRLMGMLRGSVSSAVVNAAEIPVIVAHDPRLN